MVDMREWDAIVAKVTAEPTPDDSIRALLHALADKIDGMDFYEDNVDENDARMISDELSDVAWALRAKTCAFIDAILRKPRPDVIELTDKPGDV